MERERVVGQQSSRIGGYMECRSVAQLPPKLHGNMTPNSKAGRRGTGAPFWLKQA